MDKASSQPASFRIAIVGAGKFGQALARLFAAYQPDASVLLLDRDPGTDRLQHPEQLLNVQTVVLAVPISRFQQALEQITPYLKSGTLVVDVCTVKVYPARLMQEKLPPSVQLLCTHPLFGPETLQRTGWQLNNLPLVVYPLRISETLYHKILRGLTEIGLRVIELSPQEHDRLTARSQALSLLIGALLKDMGLAPTTIDTLAFQKLLEVMEITGQDRAILQDVLRFNPAARQMAEQFLSTLQKHLREADSSTSENSEQ